MGKSRKKARSGPPAIQAERAFAAIKQTFGSNKPLAIGLAALLLLTFGWFVNATYDLPLLLDGNTALGFRLRVVGGLLAFLLVSVWLVWMASRANVTVPVIVVQTPDPPKVAGLITFLSPPGADRAQIETFAASTVGEAEPPDPRASLKGSWRMPLEALAYHAERLKYLVVIPSADDPRDPQGKPGTWRDMELFKAVVARYSGGRVAAECLPDCHQGVDYEDARAAKDGVDSAYASLLQRGLKTCDILVDITAGQKPTTIAGAAVALVEDRQFQYVSTRDYRVVTYNITYQS